MEGSQNKQVTEVTGNETKKQLRQFMNEEFSSIFEHGMAVVEGMKRKNFLSDYSQNEIGLVGPKGGFTTTVKGIWLENITIDIMNAIEAYEFIGYMLQGYIWKVKNATVNYFKSKAAN